MPNETLVSNGQGGAAPTTAVAAKSTNPANTTTETKTRAHSPHGRESSISEHDGAGRQAEVFAGSSDLRDISRKPLSGERAQATKKDFTLVNSRIPCTESSRPYPDLLMPPKGNSGIDATTAFAKTIPASSPSIAWSISS